MAWDLRPRIGGRRFARYPGIGACSVRISAGMGSD